MATRYDVGDLVYVTGTWTDAVNSDSKIDPDAVYCSVRDPDGNVTTFTHGIGAEITKESTGVYSMNISIDQSGIWYFRWWSTGSGQAAEESEIVVREQMVKP